MVLGENHQRRRLVYTLGPETKRRPEEARPEEAQLEEAQLEEAVG